VERVEVDYFELILGTLHALSEADNADTFCRSMALNVLQDLGVIATYVARLDSDNRISMIGSFGYSQQRVENTGRPSIWENMSITETIRSGKVMVYETWDDYITAYPDKGHLASPGKAFVCLPLKYHGARAGGFGITFSEPLDKAGLDPRLWEVFTSAAEVFLSKSWSSELARNPIPLKEYGEDAQFAIGSLSERERAVLGLVAEGKTNQQIARELNFSESTIKQDTIRIFKVLGVKSREEAALAWRTLQS
jgi:DNA-binding CsgD family transcriptional regulator